MLKRDVIAHFGSQIAAARAIGLTKGAVSQWPRIVPLKSALRLQNVTHGELRVDMKVYKLPEMPTSVQELRIV
jgi:transcriptional repressor of cell division inhibition gene dicB